MKKSTLATAFILLTGCISNPELRSYSRIDLSEKSITVPPGSDGLKGILKDALSDERWTLVVDSSVEITEGEARESVKLKTKRVHQTRYYLQVASRQVDVCLLDLESKSLTSKLYRFDVSIIDTKTGAETLTMSGTSCSSTIEKDFRNHIRGN